MEKKMLREKVENMPEWEIFARLIYGEASGETLEGKRAVASVVMNRLKRPARYGNSLKDVMLRRWQFSCFEEVPSLRRVTSVPYDDPVFLDCVAVAHLYMVGKLRDVVNGADHYYAESIANNPPDWSLKYAFVKKVDHHYFHVEEV